MAETVRIPLAEPPDNLRSIFERVLSMKETVLVDAGEVGVVVMTSREPEEVHQLPPGKTPEDYRAFLDSFGSRKDVDTDNLLNDFRTSRDLIRP